MFSTFSVVVMMKALSNAKGEKQILALFQDIASYLLLACGAMNIIGVCIQFPVIQIFIDS